MRIEVRDIARTFGTFEALKGVSLSIPEGQLVALLGPSGSGKTSLLRIIAGLDIPNRGTVTFDGKDSTRLTARERRVGFVFQHYALFRHMSVFENVAFGLRVKPRGKRPAEDTIRQRVMELLRLVQLDWLADRLPSQLSGGQRQRVALARALAVEPSVLLLDEPFGALDAKVRKELRRWLRRLHDDLHVTSVFVTHDVDEALEVADLVVVMNEGRIEQIGSPDSVYEQPATPFVYDFLGSVNLFHTRMERAWDLMGQAGGGGAAGPGEGRRDAVAYIRPHDIEILRVPEGPGCIEATVRRIQAIGPVVRVELDHGSPSHRIEAEIGKEDLRRLELSTGDHVFVRLTNIRVFPDTHAPAS